MKTVQIEFSKYESVNFLWSELIEDYGFDKARKIVSQAIDLQKMNGTKNNTLPIIFSGTGGLALIPIQMLEKEDLKIIVTSNIKIENLYKDGLQRDQFKPFIKIMQKQSFEYQLNIDDDYRKSKGNKTQRYYSPLNQENNFKINKLFRVMTKDKF